MRRTMVVLVAGASALWPVARGEAASRSVGAARPPCPEQVRSRPEPSPVPYATLQPTRPGEHLQLNFPPTARSGPGRLTYWLAAGEDLVIDLQAGVGPDARRLPWRLRGTLLLDGLQRRVVAAGRPAREFRVDLPRGGEGQRVVLGLLGRRIGPGAHTATLLLWREGGADFPGMTFTVVNQDRCFEPRQPTLATVAGASEATPLSVRDLGRQVPFDCQFQPSRPDARGELRMGVRLAPITRRPLAAEEKVNLALVALLDGRQIDVGQLGRIPRVTLGREERIDLNVRFRGLPADGQPHSLFVYALPGEGQATEGEWAGQRTVAAAPPLCLGQARW